jgi:hypothetical protein
MSMEDLLKGILGGGQAPRRGQQQAAPDPLADLLGGILGGVAPQPGGAGQSGGGSLPDLLGGILGGADGKVDVGDIAGILGGILGGGAAAPQPAQRRSGGLGDILGGILGAGGGNLGANSFLAPIIQELAGRLGLSPAVANAVVGFVLTQLLPRLMAGGTAAAPRPTGGRTTPRVQPQQGLDLDHLLESMGSGQQLQSSYFRSTGLADELAQQTGLDTGTAAESLQEVFALLGSQLAAGRSEPKPGDATYLDHLLDTWKD